MGDSKQDLEPKDPLLAVVIADGDYSGWVSPLCLPPCLLPLCGRVLLDLTLETLLISGVQEVLLYLSQQSSRVKKWLEGSRWAQHLTTTPLNIQVIVNEDSRSLGDACRDLDEKGIVRGDFLLVPGDLVCGKLPLEEIMSGHKARQMSDKHSVLTPLVSPCMPGHPLRLRGGEVTMATDSKSGQLIFFQRAERQGHHFPLELFSHPEVSLHFDLLDPGLAIANPAVLALFSDNFDIQTLDGLISEIIESDLVDSTIYLESVPGPLGRASCPYMFLELSARLMQRWFFPQVPDFPLSGVSLMKNNVYRANSVVLKKGVFLEEDIFLGSNSVVGENVNVCNASIGSNCIIGQGSTLANCVLFDGVSIGDGVRLENCIVGDNVTIPKGVKIDCKVLIGPNVELGEGVSITEGSKIVAENPDDWGNDEDGEDDSKLGPKAFLYQEDDNDDDESDDLEIVESGLSGWGEVYLSEDEDSSDDSSNEDSDADMDAFNEDFDDENDEEEKEDLHEDVKNFRREVVDSISRGMEQKVVTDNLVLEINGSKHAWNTTLSEVNQCVLYAVLTVKVDLEASASDLLSSVNSNIKKFSQLLLKYSKSKSGQIYYLEGLELLVDKHSAFLNILAKVLHTLYEADILDDENIINWSKKKTCTSSVSDPEALKTKIVSKIGAFLKWLEEEDSDSEEESD